MKLNDVVVILNKFNPLSIFVYGSQATQSQNTKSDYEIGVIFDDEHYITRHEIKSKVSNTNFNVFPFKISEMLNYTIDTPFQKNIYIASLISGNAKTIHGEKIIENLKPPKISKQDLLLDTSFNLGYALSAVRLMKENVNDLANEMFYKSMFYATRNLFYAKYKILLNGYNNIFEQSKNLNIPEEYQNLLNLGNKLRTEQSVNIENFWYFKNISYINKFVIPLIENSQID